MLDDAESMFPLRFDKKLYDNVKAYRDKIRNIQRDRGQGRIVPKDERKRLAAAMDIKNRERYAAEDAARANLAT
jgi:hypothetical protein